MIRAARESVYLLVQAGSNWHFDGTRHGLSDREWTALRLLASANRFSRTPSALAQFIGATRAAASQIVRRLEEAGCLQRSRSAEDKRSVLLEVTPQGKKMLARDPIEPLVNAISTLELGANHFRDILRHILEQLDTTQHRRHVDNCSQCIFLTQRNVGDKANPDFSCRYFRSVLHGKEIDLLCVNFEQRSLRRAGE
jgi:DNA-binding MarR family transcriptional regulator